MKRDDDSKAPVNVPDVEEYVDDIVEQYPHLKTGEYEDAVEALATTRRMRAAHMQRLEADPIDSYSTDLMIKLTATILRQESALGIEATDGPKRGRPPHTGNNEDDKASDGPKPIRLGK